MNKSISKFFLLTAAMAVFLLIFVTQTSYAENRKFTEKCSYNGEEIVSDYTDKEFASSIKGVQPGDSLDYIITYKNESDKTTYWYLKNSVLETLEDNSDQAQNGGYTYILKNGNTTLFDNSVGGEQVVGGLKGLKQATNATKNFFFIQELKPGESQKTSLHVEMDGETQVNTYMDTHGALRLTYGVKEKNEGGDSDDDGDDPQTPRRVKTGDTNHMIYYVIMFAASAVLLVIALLIRRNDRKRGKDA